jgi:hypothetical protein
VVGLFVCFFGVIAMKKPMYAIKKPSKKMIESWSIDQLVFWLSIHSEKWNSLVDQTIVASSENIEFLRNCVREHVAG